ncbi:MAG TPA: sigma-70 family RNA polymerase sigma factor [Chloroflexota bacterium]|nr:sigma-70 family RNA polymerase sigma factor [Chloroflexota bacterium]
MVTPDANPKGTLDNEADLVRCAVGRDSASFGSLYEFYLDRIYRYVYYRVASTTEAEDLTEQVFLKAWEAIDRYEPRGAPFVAWLYRLAHNLVVDHYRGRHSSASLDEIEDAEDAGADVESAVQDRLEAEAVRAAIGTLNPDYQQMLVLRFVEGLSHAEVAQIVGKSEGATRVIQHRALQALARALGRTEKQSSGPRERSPDQLPG